MVEFKIIGFKYLAWLLFLFVCFCKIHCQPVGRPIQMVTTTPRVYKDSFQLNKQSRPIASNNSFNDTVKWAFMPNFMIDSQNNKVEFDNSKSLDKVKAVNLGEKTIRENHDDDDDDDDGGEYTGLDGNCGSAGKKQKESVPMMLIHEMNMLAFEIPVKSQEKHDKGKEQNKLVSSNADKNEGLESSQTHWKPKAPPAIQNMEHEMRPGHSHNINNVNAFGVGDKEGVFYDMEDDVMEHGMRRGIGKNRDPYSLAGRRDVQYVLDGEREPSYGARQRSKGYHYIH